MEHTGNYYVINHLVMFIGLSDRTIRNYISSGILQGEKINGLWHNTSLPWAIPFGEDEIEVMRKQAKNILDWYDDMRNTVPKWYSK